MKQINSVMKNKGEQMRKKRTMITLVIAILLFMVLSCSVKHPANLVGTWEKIQGDNYSWGNRITLGRDGTGTYSSELMGGSFPITWRVENKRLYLIGFDLPAEYEYSISKSELTLKTSVLGTTTMAIYRKQR